LTLHTRYIKSKLKVEDIIRQPLQAETCSYIEIKVSDVFDRYITDYFECLVDTTGCPPLNYSKIESLYIQDDLRFVDITVGDNFLL
jgi:hypothetical protein